jgi:hypothetical protein
MSTEHITPAPPLRALANFRITIPEGFRALVRGREVWLVVLAAVVGCIAGLSVVAINAIVDTMHLILFDLDAGSRLSSVEALPSDISFLVPVLGGFVVAAIGFAVALTKRPRPVDPIEANALHGGRMSVRDSLLVTAQTIISNGFGASVGLEAGYTQLVAGVASRLGVGFRLRRADLRMIVGCGAASAIAAAFGAPLTGAFYGFELIIGTYTAAALAPVLTASIAGTLVAHLFGVEPYAITVTNLSADGKHRARCTSFVIALEQLQSSLGDLNDIETGNEIAAEVAGPHPAAAGGPCGIDGPRNHLDEQERRTAALVRSACKAHRRLSAVKPFWKST